MLKNVTLWVFGFCIFAIVGMTVYDQYHYAQTKSYDINCEQPLGPSGTTNTMVCTANNSEKTPEGQENPPKWHVFFAWPEGITATLLGLTLVAIVWQAVATQQAAQATLDQSNVARQALVAQFRPRLSVRYVRFTEIAGSLFIEAKIINRGDADAHIKRGRVEGLILNRIYTLSKHTDYEEFTLRGGNPYILVVNFEDARTAIRGSRLVFENSHTQSSVIQCRTEISYTDDNGISRTTIESVEFCRSC